MSLVSGAQAALVGRDLDNNLATFEAYYDDDLNITWLADANASGVTMGWNDAMACAGALSIGGYTNWRLPNNDPSCIIVGCVNGEMGHLFYNELGGSAWNSILTSTDPDLAKFSNIVVAQAYWSATQDSNPAAALRFMFSVGAQGSSAKTMNLRSWAVHPGDIGASAVVPVPAALWLFGSAFGLLGWARLKAV